MIPTLLCLLSGLAYQGEIWTADYYAVTVTVLDAETLEPLATIPLEADYAMSLAFSDDGAIAYVMTGDWGANAHDVVAIDGDTREVVGRVTLPGELCDGLIHQQHDSLYITDCCSDVITVLDAASLSLVDTISLSSERSSFAMDFTPDGQFAYAGDCTKPEHTGGLFQVDLFSNAVVTHIDLGVVSVNEVAISPDGTRLVGTGQRWIHVIDLATGLETARITAQDAPILESRSPRGAVFDAQSRYAFVTAQDHVLTVDLSDPAAPVIASATPVTRQDGRWSYLSEIKRSGDRLYAVHFGSPAEVQMWDISDPLAPTLLAASLVGAGAYEFGLRRIQPRVLSVAIDIQPGSAVGCLNNDGHGAIPVVIFGSPELDVHAIAIDTLRLESMPVRSVGNGRPQARVEDANRDGSADLVVQFEDVAGSLGHLEEGILTGNLVDGTSIHGADAICLVP
jgi:hypothetical protein